MSCDLIGCVVKVNKMFFKILIKIIFFKFCENILNMSFSVFLLKYNI